MFTYFDDSMMIKTETDGIIAADDDSESEVAAECFWFEGSVGGELTRSLCGLDRTQPRRIRPCSPSPPGHVDVAGTARSSSPGKLAPSLSRSNSGSGEEEQQVALPYICTVRSRPRIKTCMQPMCSDVFAFD